MLLESMEPQTFVMIGAGGRQKHGCSEDWEAWRPLSDELRGSTNVVEVNINGTNS